MAGSWERLGAAWAGANDKLLANPEQERRTAKDMEYRPALTLKERMARLDHQEKLVRFGLR